MSRWVLVFVLTLLAIGCATVGIRALDQLYGVEDPTRFDRPASPVAGAPDFARDVKPILDSRCVVCHACYDAPCQLQLGSYDGVIRGANPEKVYNSARLIEAPQTRLFMDAEKTSDWRKKGFFPVLNERNPDREINLKASVLGRVLTLKNEYPGPVTGLLPNEHFDFSLDRAQVCPNLQSITDYQRRHPEWGMPYGLPALEAQDQLTLVRWLEAGAPASLPRPLPASDLERIRVWESFLNGETAKTQLMARYVFEHWFLAHLYFDDRPTGRFYELVRSATPPGEKIQLIATRRPYDDPGVPRVYYRFRPVESTLVSKTHMPYALNPQKLGRMKGWFLDPPYEVKSLPGYEVETASNPFIAFKAIPATARYRLLLDEAQFTVMGFIKGPSCRGQTALDVIDDYFWIAFANPDLPELKDSSVFLSEILTHISLPTRDESNSLLPRWLIYANQETDFLKRKAAWQENIYKGKNAPTLAKIWDGDGQNANASLTVFRHFDSASVEKGLLGRSPQKALLVGYEGLERIHYLLVAGFDVYGNVGHQLESRLYMDFLRMEGEHNVLMALPRKSRMAVRDHWYRGASEEVRNYVLGDHYYYDQESGIHYQTQDPLQEFYDLWKAYLAKVQPKDHGLDPARIGSGLAQNLETLAAIQGKSLQFLPENSFLTVRGGKGAHHHFTLLRNSAHSNIAQLFDEAERRLPDEDTLYVGSGFIGAYPNVFYRVDERDLPDFIQRIAALASEKDYQELASRYAIRRTDPGFWSHSDLVRSDFSRMAPMEAATFDLNRYENR